MRVDYIITGTIETDDDDIRAIGDDMRSIVDNDLATGAAIITLNVLEDSNGIEHETV